MEMLRVGVVLADPEALSAGELRLLETLCVDPRYRLVALFVCQPRREPEPSLFRLAMVLESRLFVRHVAIPTPAYRKARRALPVLDLADGSADAVRMDVVVDFTHDPRALALAPRARFGVWRLSSFAEGAGWPEAALGSATTTVALVQQLAGHDRPTCVAKAQYRTRVLASHNASFIREKSVQLVRRELARLLTAEQPECSRDEQAGFAVPPSRSCFRYSLQLGAAACRRMTWNIFLKVGAQPGLWTLRYGSGDPHDFDPSKGSEILPPPNRYWADPFLHRHEGTTFVFFEEFDRIRRKGHISVGRLSNAKFSLIGPALQTDYHLSFPYIFEFGGSLFMLPETSETKRIEIWRCHRFPDEWKLWATALEGECAADSCIIQNGNDWWLFTNLSNDSFGDHSSELHVFHADSPRLEHLVPHALNPVVIDASTARGGGRVFYQNGRLYRASQHNAAGQYGYGLNLMEVTHLTRCRYQERVVRRIRPDFEFGITGCHHFDAVGSFYVIDVRKLLGGWRRSSSREIAT